MSENLGPHVGVVSYLFLVSVAEALLKLLAFFKKLGTMFDTTIPNKPGTFALKQEVNILRPFH